MTGRKLLFTGVRQVQTLPLELPSPAPDQLLVAVSHSAISPGTEMLVYRGELPTDLSLDANIAALAGGPQYPLAYGYAAVGQVIASGAALSDDWVGRLVFAFQPHASHFLARPAEVIPVPAGIAPEDAVFLPNMETAVSFLMDGRPIIGEQVLVLGQGVVGLLTALLLAQIPLASLITVDNFAARRERSAALTGARALAPAELAAEAPHFDLTYELSGSPAALDQAIAATGDYGRVVIGSWYGSKRAELNLGGRFHRSHMELISSQVSELKPIWTGRWDKRRRLELAWEMIRRQQPARLISHRFPLSDAASAYQLLDQAPADCLQILFRYAGETD
ncbi:MAG: zinc-binding alcohol dehydrogenase [Anaerolineales bacterium]|nr:zinc-binding alcohol dehydrogenase [Anaerolineales bacterium]